MLQNLLSRASGIALGTAAGHALVLLATPYLARRYSPEQFGLLALLLTVTNISIAAGCLRYDLALPSSKPTEARGLLTTAIGISIAMGLLAVGLALAVGSADWARPASELIASPWLLGGCVTLVGLNQATAAWFLHQGQFGRVAWLRFSQGAAFSTFALFPVLGLGWAQVLSFAGGLACVPALFRRGTATEAPWHEAARRQLRFPLMSLPGALLDVVGYSLCIWVIVVSFGQAVAGNYSQIQRLIGAPMMLLSISLGQVLLKQTAGMTQQPEQLRRLVLRTWWLMIGLGTACTVVLWFAGEPLLQLVLGPQWRVDREFVTLVAIAVFIRAAVSPLSSVLVTLRCFKGALLWQVLYFCSAALLMPWVAGHFGFNRFLMFYSFHELVFYSFYLALILRVLRRSVANGNQACGVPADHAK